MGKTPLRHSLLKSLLLGAAARRLLMGHRRPILMSHPRRPLQSPGARARQLLVLTSTDSRWLARLGLLVVLASNLQATGQISYGFSVRST
jgi:hypothetical protein